MAKFITKSDYLNSRGIDLDIELKNSATDNPAGVVNGFLNKVEDEMLDYMEATFEVDINHLDSEIMKKALIYQIDYIRQYGNDEAKYVLAPKAYRKLWEYGYANIKTDGRRGIRSYGHRC